MASAAADFRRHGKVSKGQETAPGGRLPPEAQRALGAPRLGYSSSGCVPAEPDSASPGTIIIGWNRRRRKPFRETKEDASEKK